MQMPDKKNASLKAGFSKRAIVSIILSLVVTYVVVGMVLALVNHITEPVFVKRERERTLALESIKSQEKLVKTVVPDADSVIKLGDWTVHEKNVGYYCVKKGGVLQGYVIQSYGKGYQSLISVLIAVDTAFTVSRVDIKSQEETPGLGSEVATDDFKKQFIGKKIGNLKVSTSGESDLVQAISGATISSRAVTEDAVRNAVDFLKNKSGLKK